MNDADLIAVGADEKGGVWKDHFGVSPVYRLYDLTGTLVEERANPHASANHHGNPLLIAELLEGCSVWIAATVGPKRSMVEERGIRVILTQAETADEAVAAYLRGER
ncbi:NifB/NifX family molybdenum-iron cluster-binding protein [Salinispira pacifica]|uniref:NifB/NifX family molybdenum-iron cluster-binding protein n=1 Tax=Salinispira pacifica TaxID=1307761 RepID=UPI00059C9EC3|nr:NifB/NifX family molybdenum-iron cluster-binding protein [Salinispira pacifica]